MADLALILLLLAGPGQCAGCHADLAARVAGSVMAVREIGGRSVGGCLDCHVTGDSPADGCDVAAAVPLERCFGCHHDPRGLPLNPAGVVVTHYGGAHHERSGGLLCQDCHTSGEMHGRDDGAAGPRLEIGCADCHGTLDAEPRLLDGLAVSGRGAPLGNVVARDGGMVLLSATGREFAVPVLHDLARRDAWSTATGRRAMVEAAAAHERLACLDCHADWVPTCHGCHAEAGGGS